MDINIQGQKNRKERLTEITHFHSCCYNRYNSLVCTEIVSHKVITSLSISQPSTVTAYRDRVRFGLHVTFTELYKA